MPRFSNIKDTLIEINKMNSQTGTRYRESGFVHRPGTDIGVTLLDLVDRLPYIATNKNGNVGDTHGVALTGFITPVKWAMLWRARFFRLRDR